MEENQSIPLWKTINSQRKATREEGRNNGIAKQPENNKIAFVSPYLSILFCKYYVNGLNSPNKRYKVIE